MLLAAGCRTARKQGPADAELLRYVPQETVVLAGLHMRELLASPIYQKLQVQKRLPPLEGATLEEALVAYNGKNIVVIGRGTFQPGAWTVVDSRTALAGDPAAVRAAVDRFKNGGAPLELVTRAQALPGQSQIWAVADNRLAALVPATGNASNLRKFFGPMDDLALVAEVGESLHATLTGNFRTEQDAKDLGVAARGILGLGRLSIPRGQPDLERLYDTVSVEQRQRTIKVESTVPADLIDRLAALTAGR